ncbi:MAG: hypothetical protein HFI60_11585 [Lachnospiraceae bacterium]|jgi:hypothetical protein|nr:hypothetical protein [Lachnospiraceae bacterium]
MLNDQCTTDFDGSPVLWEGRPVSIIEWIAAQRLDVKCRQWALGYGQGDF